MRSSAVFAAVLLFAIAAPARAQGSADTLKVCADPNNLPFSNRAEQGFENRLAQIWAREAGRQVEYEWFPQRRGFERNTLERLMRYVDDLYLELKAELGAPTPTAPPPPRTRKRRQKASNNDG